MMTESELYHHGIKGQKWGIRRFQNPDGTLTDAGRKRLSEALGRENVFASDREIAKDKVLNSSLQQKIDELRPLRSKLDLQPLRTEFFSLDADEVKDYYKEPIKKRIEEDLNDAYLEKEDLTDKFLKDTYDLKTDYVLRDPYINEDAFEAWVNSKHPGELEKRKEYGREYSNKCKEISEDLLGKYHDEPSGVGKFSKGTQLRTIIAGIMDTEYYNADYFRSNKTKRKK